MISVEKLQFPTDFSQKFNKHSSKIVLPWQHLSVRLDLYVLKWKAYKIILKVRKFQLPTYYRFSTADWEIWLWVDSAPPGLNKVKDKS